MKDLLSEFTSFHTGNHTATLYNKRTWELKPKYILLYLNDVLGNLDLELTCSIFSLNVTTFHNWTKQKMYLGKMDPLCIWFYSLWYIDFGACHILIQVQLHGPLNKDECWFKVSKLMSRQSVLIFYIRWKLIK